MGRRQMFTIRNKTRLTPDFVETLDTNSVESKVLATNASFGITL